MGLILNWYETNVTSGNFDYTVVFMLVLHLKIFSLKDYYEFYFQNIIVWFDRFYLIFPAFIHIISHCRVNHQHCIKAANQPTTTQPEGSVSAGGLTF